MQFKPHILKRLISACVCIPFLPFYQPNTPYSNGLLTNMQMQTKGAQLYTIKIEIKPSQNLYLFLIYWMLMTGEALYTLVRPEILTSGIFFFFFYFLTIFFYILNWCIFCDFSQQFLAHDNKRNSDPSDIPLQSLYTIPSPPGGRGERGEERGLTRFML